MSLSKEYISDSSDSEIEDNFTVPKGYHQVKKFHPLPKNLNNKEIWLIKTPKNFDFKNLSKIPISFNPLEQSQSFENNGLNYSCNEDLTNNNLQFDINKFKILKPSNENNLKIDKDLKIDKFYNIKQTVTIPEIQFHKVFKQRQNVRVIKGLKPQHFATGYQSTDLDIASDNDDDDDNDKNNNEEDEPSSKKIKLEKKEKKSKKDKRDKREKKIKK
ncbi:hypothetical protein WICMUC_004936 [Wickerhamomyces mucosus]|uniref:Uncharacterized protein n=1 Tax=Wickerhamomyces mucosus TaxID=1378264 RepID=A0A9P8PDJ8_9ASCO|nr:hypothetical protein WICMUC_004936 [Wickerhamomyces mucosus]